MLDAGHRMSPHLLPRLTGRCTNRTSPSIKARAVGSLYTLDAETFGPVIEGWLADDETERLGAGILAAGVSRDMRFAGRLKTLLAICDNEALLLLVLTACARFQGGSQPAGGRASFGSGSAHAPRRTRALSD
jgi:hypothetical protein